DEKQIKPWSLPELLLQLSNDSQTIAKILKQHEEKRIEREQAANLEVQKEQEEQTAQSFTPYWNFSMIDDDDDEHTIQYSESEDTSGSNNDCDLPLSDDFSPISIFEEKSVTFFNPLFDLNDFTSSDNESLSDEDVSEDNVKIYSNPLFEFDDEYISSDVNPLFDEVLEDIECKDSFESTFLVTPLFDSNKDECFTPSDDVELLLHHDPSISVVSILEGFTDEPPLEENDNLFDLESKMNDWKKILYAAPIDDLITEDKVFDPRIHEIIFSPTNGSLPFEDHH
ncbi:hypothetical protein Tco_1413508, partial [Tanacetum coccineum]